MANVMIVEDSHSAAAAHAYSLWEFGHTVTFAYSAQEARAAFQAENHDVVLLDFELPDGSGLEVFRTLRQVDPDVCVVMVTGRGNERLASQILKEGADDYLTKSSELLGILPEVVERVLKEKKTRQQLAVKEQELNQAHAALQRKVDELAEANGKLQQTLAELGRSQSQMLQSEKMASVGQLAAGVAHEINNPVGFISSNLYTLGTYFRDIHKIMAAHGALCDRLRQADIRALLPQSVRQQCADLKALEEEVDLDYIMSDGSALVKESQQGAERIKNIVADLKNFAHPGSRELETIDLNANIESTVNLVWHELKYKSEIAKQLGSLPLVQCHPQMISQVFMNLLVNAAQAIEGKGIITIRTRAEGERVVIQIHDTGTGIPEANLSKIFDPFFTTKPVGQGTGLGLKVVYDIIQEHRGDITVDSAPGQGTEFTIRLPVSRDCR